MCIVIFVPKLYHRPLEGARYQATLASMRRVPYTPRSMPVSLKTPEAIQKMRILCNGSRFDIESLYNMYLPSKRKSPSYTMAKI